MTDLRTAANTALYALEFNYPLIEDYGNKKQLDIHHEAIMALHKALAQPEQEKPLPLVDIGVDVTPEGTHVVACYNRPDAVQEMFYSQFHPLTKPEQEPVCDKDPFYCWSIRCQAGKVCNHAQPEPPFQLTDAGADTNITRGLEPKGKGMVTLNQVGMRVDLKDGTRKEWVGLTDEEIDAEMYARLESETFVKGVKWAEERLKEKNNAV